MPPPTLVSSTKHTPSDGVIQNSVQGNATINYSSCAIEKMQKATATIAMSHERPWMEMF